MLLRALNFNSYILLTNPSADRCLCQYGDLIPSLEGHLRLSRNCHCETIPTKSEGEAISEIATGFALAMTKTSFLDSLIERDFKSSPSVPLLF